MELLVLLSRKQGYFDQFGFNGGHMKDKHDTDIVQKSSFFMDLLIFLWKGKTTIRLFEILSN